jgi:hypothetical protein
MTGGDKNPYPDFTDGFQVRELIDVIGDCVFCFHHQEEAAYVLCCSCQSSSVQ